MLPAAPASHSCTTGTSASWTREAGLPRPLVRDFVKPGSLEGAPVVVAHGETATPEVLLHTAMNAIGGMAAFISRGDVVVLKPNIGWDRTPKQAANTSPAIVAATIRMVLDAGAKEVIVTDGSCNDPFRCYSRSGIGKAAQELGAEVMLPADHRFRKMNLKGEVLDEWPVLKPIVEADKVINIPNRQASQSGPVHRWHEELVRASRRPPQPVAPEHRREHCRPGDIPASDADHHDAVNVLVRNGPQGGSLKDVMAMHKVAVSADQVALDAWGCTLLDLKKEDIPYLKMGHERGIGDMNYEPRLKEIAVTG